MATMKAEYVNPFILALGKVLKDMCMVDAKIGKPYLREASYEAETSIIMIGITGDITGYIMLAFEQRVALDIVSKMMMMPVEEMSEIAVSAISELGNMMMGNAATVFSTKGIFLDITPPNYCYGSVSFPFHRKNFCVPLIYEEDKRVLLDIDLKDA